MRAILEFSGLFILKIVYGEKYTERKKGLEFLFCMVNGFWLVIVLCFILGITQGKFSAADNISTGIVSVAYPVAIALWRAVVKKKNAQQTTTLNSQSEIETTNDTVTQKSKISDTSSSDDIPSEIKRYKELLDSGAITQEEFEAKKKQLLNL